MTTVALVTGGNRGIGREVARQLAERGLDVVLTARSAEAAAGAARAVNAEPLPLDVTDPASVAAAARWTSDRYGKPDVLVNNAAITYDTWQRAAGADLAVVRGGRPVAAGAAARTPLAGLRSALSPLL
jgi:NAD(P)-dependent dehydrogenase (short-subunit alcohol dehydrogenase family)